jgi:hypothetical protein
MVCFGNGYLYNHQRNNFEINFPCVTKVAVYENLKNELCNIIHTNNKIDNHEHRTNLYRVFSTRCLLHHF